MARDNFRITTAERHRALEESQASRPRRAAQKAALWTGFGLRRSLDAASRFVERLTSRGPSRAVDDDASDPVLIVGHRGAPYKVVENTIESCARAVDEEGANALEIDLCLTRDGHVVLWHDWDPNDTVALARQLGVEPGVKFSPVAPALWDEYRRHVDELTLDELREHYAYAKKFWFFFKRPCAAHVPTLEEFTEWARTRPGLKAVFLDLKLPADRLHLVEPLIQSMRRVLEAQPVAFRCVWMTPHQSVFDAIRKLAPDLDLCLDTELPPGILRNPEQYSAARKASELGSRVASVGRPVLTWGGWKIYQQLVADDLALLKATAASAARPIDMLAWTFDHRGESKRILRLGVQGILTNRPGRVRRIAKKANRRLA